jgi:hypothetical protein
MKAKTRNEIKRIDEKIEKVIGLYDDLIGRIEGLKKQLEIPAPTAPAPAPADKRGLDALFDKAPMYRHVCVNEKCKAHRINRLSNGMRCLRCNSPMDARPVTRRGARGHYKQRNKIQVIGKVAG